MTSEVLQHEKFEKKIFELLKLLGKSNVYSNVTGSYLDHDYKIDIVFGSQGDFTAVELKSYRPNYPPSLIQLKNALMSISTNMQYFQAEKGLLVVSCQLSKNLKDIAGQYKEIEIWDIKDVLARSKSFPEFHKELLLILDILPAKISRKGTEKIEIDDEFINSKQVGMELIEDQKNIKPGKDMAFEYESTCINALKHIFDSNLSGWHEQHQTVDGLNRRDLICRVLPDSEVWDFILTDLKSRYVVFEFKNYSKPITQKEVITTERYLYPRALRKVAVIIAHNDYSESARKVMEGAMREHGKLIIVLSNNDLIKLINMKDNGSDPNSYIFDVVDQFLMSLGR